MRVDAPNSSIEINRNVTKLLETPSEDAGSVVLCVPRLVGGKIHVMDTQRHHALISFPVNTILFCAGCTDHKDCFGFTSTTSQALSHPHDARLTSVDGIASPELKAEIQQATEKRTQANSRSASPKPGTSAAPVAPRAFYSHLFQMPTVVKRDHVLECIASAFGRVSKDSDAALSLDFEFEFAVGISEADAKGTLAYCPLTKVPQSCPLSSC